MAHHGWGDAAVKARKVSEQLGAVPAAAGPARGLFETREVIAARVEQVRRLQTIPAGSVIPSRLSAEAVEEDEKEDGDEGVEERGAEVAYHDPYVPVIKPTREHPQFEGRKSVDWNRAMIENFDLVLIATNHSSVNYDELSDWAQCIVDTRNAMDGIDGTHGKVWKA